MPCLKNCLSPCKCDAESQSKSVSESSEAYEYTKGSEALKKRQRQKSVNLSLEAGPSDDGVSPGCFGNYKKPKEDKNNPGASILLKQNKKKRTPAISVTPSDDASSSYDESQPGSSYSAGPPSRSGASGYNPGALNVPGNTPSPVLRDDRSEEEKEEEADFKNEEADLKYHAKYYAQLLEQQKEYLENANSEASRAPIRVLVMQYTNLVSDMKNQLRLLRYNRLKKQNLAAKSSSGSD